MLHAALAVGAETAAQRADVQSKSARMMPFAMDATMHHFRRGADGGTQAVVVTDGDSRRIALVRSQLRKEAAHARCDYCDVASAFDGEGRRGGGA